ncbi:MAG: DUF4834 family protein [Prevotella sp.]|jgi:FtsZ-interacting cell division protein ZipA
MLKSFFSILFIIILVGILTIALIVLHFLRSLHRRAMDAFRSADDTSRTGNFTQGKTTTTESGETIVDARDPETANRKIFDKDEGEYVKFKEVE